ncbi:MAG: hypothetical protein II309_02690 [Bacilli bacterium]|nr:hypothetical protein [Bacilli bacterium]
MKWNGSLSVIRLYLSAVKEHDRSRTTKEYKIKALTGTQIKDEFYA